MITGTQIQAILLFFLAMAMIPVVLVKAEEQQKHYDLVHQEQVQ